MLGDVIADAIAGRGRETSQNNTNADRELLGDVIKDALHGTS
jgi:hypothetical protein